MRDASSAGRSLIGLVVMLAGPAQAAGIPASAGSLGPGAAGVLTPTQARETEDRLRQVIAGLEQGQPDYDQMEPALRIAVRQQIGATTGMLQVLGPIQSITYEGKQGNADAYDVRFAGGEAVWLIALSPDGKIATLFVNRPVFAPAATQSRLEQVIRQLQQGEPDYDQMTPTLRAAVERQLETSRIRLRALGPVQAIAYKGQEQGADAYDVRFANGEAVWLIGLSPDGKTATLWFH